MSAVWVFDRKLDWRARLRVGKERVRPLCVTRAFGEQRLR